MYLYDGGNELQLEIIDNGCGIAQSEQQKKGPGPKSFGLRSIKERVISLGGTLSIASGQEKGTIITICVPLPISPNPFD
jgi:signal transduction histidine kinase